MISRPVTALMERYSAQMEKKETKSEAMRVRLPASELAAFQARCAEMGLTSSHVMRRLVRMFIGAGPSFDGETREVIRSMTAQMRAIGVNINQVARLMNSGRVPADEDLQVSFVLLVELLKEQEQFLVSLCARARARAVDAIAEAE